MQAQSKLTGKDNHIGTTIINNNNGKAGGWTKTQWEKPCLRKKVRANRVTNNRNC